MHITDRNNYEPDLICRSKFYFCFVSEPLWRAAVNQFENSLVPAERRIAGKLRSQLRNMHGNTLQLLQEFKRYKELIKRPSIQRFKFILNLTTQNIYILTYMHNLISRNFYLFFKGN